NGFVTFAATSSLPQNSSLTSAKGALPEMIAPLWDDLNLGDNSQVLFLVEGNTFPRRLIIQWNKLMTGDAGSELTFQVQLLETGEFRFGYKTLTDPTSALADAQIGWHLDKTLSGALPPGPAVADDEFVWSTGGAPTGSLTLNPRGPGVFTLFGQTS